MARFRSISVSLDYTGCSKSVKPPFNFFIERGDVGKGEYCVEHCVFGALSTFS